MVAHTELQYMQIIIQRVLSTISKAVPNIRIQDGKPLIIKRITTIKMEIK